MPLKEKHINRGSLDTAEAGRTSSFTWLVNDAVSNTGIQGLPNITRSKSLPRRITWSIICVLGIGVMIWQIGLAIQKYYQYPTSTTVEYKYQTYLEFPAVTICNNNPIKKSLLENNTAAESLKQLMAEADTSSNSQDQMTTQEMGQVTSNDNVDYLTSSQASSILTDGNHISTSNANIELSGSGSDESGSGLEESGSGLEESGSGLEESGSGSEKTIPGNSGSVQSVVAEESGSGSDYSGSYGGPYHYNQNDNNNNNDGYNNYGYNNYGYGGYYYDYDYFDDDWVNAQTDEDFAFIENFISLASKLDRSEKIQLGHNLDTMMITCNWQGKKCTTQHFESFYNYMYGNCYTFNSGRSTGNHSKTVLKTSKVGPLYGFKMELFIEQDQYISGLSDGAGVRLIIHNQTYMPFPEDFAISLAPGTKTSVGIKRKEVYRTTFPHGSCKEYNKLENTERNAFLGDIKTLTYTVQTCIKTCFQKALMLNCSCYDYKIPSSPHIAAFSDIYDKLNDTALSRCDDELANNTVCLTNVTQEFIMNKLGCSQLCHVPCFEAYFDSDVSYSQWPSEASQSHVLKSVASKSEYFNDIIHRSMFDDVWKKQWISNNFLKLEVYFSDLNYEVVKTFPSYDTIALISDLGGQAGLWLGVSIIAFFELFEVVIDTAILLSRHCLHKTKRNNVIEVKPIANNGGVTKSVCSVDSVCTTTSILSHH